MKFLDYLAKITGKSYDIVYISGLAEYQVIEKDTFQPGHDLIQAPKKGDIYLSIDFNPVQSVNIGTSINPIQKVM